MRTSLAVLMVVGSLAAAPLALAAAPAGSPAAAAKTSKAAQSAHATSGTVQSITDSSLVVTKSGRRHRVMTFQLDPSVHKEGTLAVGSHVSIRYRDDGSKHIATAITAGKTA